MAKRKALDLPRAPVATRGRQLYESHYLTAIDPGGGRAVWLRYTAHKEAGEPARGQLWCTVFGLTGAPSADDTAMAPAPPAAPAAPAASTSTTHRSTETRPALMPAPAAATLARRTRSAEVLPTPPAGTWAQIDDATIAPGRAWGALEDCEWAIAWRGPENTPATPGDALGGAHDASSTSGMGTPASRTSGLGTRPASPSSAELAYLPRWLYDRRLPRSNGAALVPDAVFAGYLDVADQRIEIDGWRGMVGHNWGRDHADRWIWVHATGLGRRDPHGWLDMVLARVRLGPVLSPWLPAGGVMLDGRLRRIAPGPGIRGLRVRVTEGVEMTEEVEVAGRVGDTTRVVEGARCDTVAETRLELELPHLSFPLPNVAGVARASRGRGLTLTATFPETSTARWDYATPGGGGRDVRNCSIASGRLTVGDGPAIEIDGTLAVEIGV